MKNFKLFLLIVTILFLSACQEKDEKSNKQFDNKILTIISPNFDKAIAGPIKAEVALFEEKTGAKVRIVSPSWDDMIPKIKESLHDDKINYDVFVIFSSWAGSILSNNHALEINDEIQKQLEWDDILPIYKENVLSWNNKYYFFPYDGDSINLYYRKDIFSNSKYQQKFLKEYGYTLDVPKTWNEYHDIAQFFSGWDWDNDGKIEYGIAEPRIKGYGTMLQFFARAASYAKYPNDKTFYFDMDMTPKINNPSFVKALEEYIDVMQYAPVETINYSPVEVRQSFIGGKVAMAIDWADTGAMGQNAKETQVKNKVGYAKLPGAMGVYNSNEKKWEHILNTPSSISGNWVMVVNKNSENQELALAFTSFMTSKEMTGKYVPKGWSGINPSRYSHLQTADLTKWEQNSFSSESAKEYLEVISSSLSNTNVVHDIRLPGADLYYASFDKYLNLAITKQMSAQEALDQTAKQWNEITQTLGKENQIQLYKESLNE